MSKRGRGRPPKDDPALNHSIRFTKAQLALIVRWQEEHQLPDFTAAVHDLITRALGE